MMYPMHNIDEISDLLLDYAIALMGAGSHTSRVVRNLTRIANSFGYGIDVTIFQKSVLMTVSSLNDGSVCRTTIRKIKPMGLNFQIVSRLSTLSWDTFDNKLELTELRRQYNQIMAESRMSHWVVLLLVALANASFCRLFEGDFKAMALVFAGTLIAFFVRQQMMARHANHYLVFIVCAFISSFITAQGIIYSIGDTPEIALATSVLFLVPGVPLINSIIDTLEGHVLAGVSRMINACLLMACIAFGLLITLLILGIHNL